MECNIFWEQVELEEYSIYSVYSTSQSGLAGRTGIPGAGIAEIVVKDLDGLWNFIPDENRMISVPFELE